MLFVHDIDVFHGDAQALDKVSLEVPERAIVASGGVFYWLVRPRGHPNL